MSGTPSSLPDLHQLDSDALRTLILSQHECLTAQHEQILSQREQLASCNAEIEQLRLLIAKLRRMQFGRKSEKVERQIEQLQLQLDELETKRAENEVSSAAWAASAPAEPRARKPARRPLPEHLPRETRTILPKQTACPECGGELKHLGQDVSEMLEYVPEHFKVVRQVRPKLACGRCDKIVQAEAPSLHLANGPTFSNRIRHSNDLRRAVSTCLPDLAGGVSFCWRNREG